MHLILVITRMHLQSLDSTIDASFKQGPYNCIFMWLHHYKEMRFKAGHRLFFLRGSHLLFPSALAKSDVVLSLPGYRLYTCRYELVYVRSADEADAFFFFAGNSESFYSTKAAPTESAIMLILRKSGIQSSQLLVTINVQASLTQRWAELFADLGTN
jgi:hypothetical protein